MSSRGAESGPYRTVFSGHGGLVGERDGLARAAVARRLPPDASLEELLAYERSTGPLVALNEAFDDLVRWRRGSRSDAVAVAAAVRSTLARIAEALRPVLERFGLA